MASSYTDTHKKYYEKHKAAILAKYIPYGKDYRRRLKLEALAQYGTVCYCCGEAVPEMLTLDHIANDGAARRRELWGKNHRGGYNFYLKLKQAGWPAGLQASCHNCNQGKFLNGGVCPHGKKI